MSAEEAGSAAMNYYLYTQDRVMGPYNAVGVMGAADIYGQGAETLATREGSEEWMPLCEMEELMGDAGREEEASTGPAGDKGMKSGEESVFFQRAGVRVTTTRFIVGGQTFAMSGITSVKMVEIPPKVGCATALLLIGIATLVGGFSIERYGIAFLGLVIAATGHVVRESAKSTFSVVLRTSGGEVTAYQSADEQHIQEVMEALNGAIVARG